VNAATPGSPGTPDGFSDPVTAATAGQAACEAAGENWNDQGPERRGKWEAVAKAAREYRGPLPPQILPEYALSAAETAYRGYTARQGPRRLCWEVLTPEERADWHGVIRALARRVAISGSVER
jgi:hypothetical protein